MLENECIRIGKYLEGIIFFSNSKKTEFNCEVCDSRAFVFY